MNIRITKDDLTPGLQDELKTISDHRPILEAMGLQLQSLRQSIQRPPVVTVSSDPSF